MKDTIYVDVDSFDFARWNDAYAECAVEAARSMVSAGGIDHGEVAARIAQEAVTNEVRVKIESGDVANKSMAFGW